MSLPGTSPPGTSFLGTSSTSSMRVLAWHRGAAPVDELVLVLPRALWRRCRSRGRHLRERRSWERRALARWTDLPVTQRTSWCSMRWSPPSPFYGVDAPRDRCYASTGTERRQEETMNQSMTIGIDLAKHVFFIAALD